LSSVIWDCLFNSITIVIYAKTGSIDWNWDSIDWYFIALNYNWLKQICNQFWYLSFIVQVWELQCEVCAHTISVKERRLNDLSHPKHGVGVCKRRIVQSATCL